MRNGKNIKRNMMLSMTPSGMPMNKNMKRREKINRLARNNINPTINLNKSQMTMLTKKNMPDDVMVKDMIMKVFE
jgi:hypothetical protein